MEKNVADKIVEITPPPYFEVTLTGHSEVEPGGRNIKVLLVFNDHDEITLSWTEERTGGFSHLINPMSLDRDSALALSNALAKMATRL